MILEGLNIQGHHAIQKKNDMAYITLKGEAQVCWIKIHSP